MRCFVRQSTLLLLAALCMASTLHADEVDDIVQAELKRQKIPAVSIAVCKAGKIVKEAGYGFANLEHNVPAKPETIYQSGSVGKMFTAALVMLLVEDGKLALDDPVSKHLPQVSEKWKDITVRQLLTHTSGLADPYAKLDLTRNYTDEELIRIDGDVPTLFSPGAKWSYSNMGYHVLGFLCNKVGGKFYGDQLAERIFKPCGMHTARMINEHDIIPNRAAGYEPQLNGTLKNQRWVSPNLNRTADGSIYLTVRDLAAWDGALRENKLFKSSSRDLIWSPVKLNDEKTFPYGFGWSLGPILGRPCHSHGGAWQGFTTHIACFQDEPLTVIVLTNSARANPGRIGLTIAKHYLPVKPGEGEKK